MEVKEVTLNGKTYRGPQLNSAKGRPYKINVYRESSRVGTSGGPVGMSWQTWMTYTSAPAAVAAMEELIEQAEREG